MEKISSWGNYPTIRATVLRPTRDEQLAALIQQGDTLIARGNGRSYGDSALQEKICATLNLNKILAFDTEQGTITCESGVLLDDLLKVMVPMGYFLPVVPGTRYITAGGAVAANVHGKNHHQEGAIGAYVERFELIDERGKIWHCSRQEHPDRFKQTIGGMGLTGVILWITFHLKKIETAYITQQALCADNLETLLHYFDLYKNHTYSVAWIDCLAKGSHLGRSVLLLGEHTSEADLDASKKMYTLKVHTARTINIPFFFPSYVLNRFSIKVFNFLYYQKYKRTKKQSLLHYADYFFPLDKLNNWNRIYGKPGFVQYQFVIPYERGAEALKIILQKIADSGQGSFLAVLKTFGKADPHSSCLSFPMEGYTLALDFKVNAKVFQLLNALDEVVLSYGGRLYLAKDARMSKAFFNKSYTLDMELSSTFESIQSSRLIQ